MIEKTRFEGGFVRYVGELHGKYCIFEEIYRMLISLLVILTFDKISAKNETSVEGLSHVLTEKQKPFHIVYKPTIRSLTDNG